MLDAVVGSPDGARVLIRQRSASECAGSVQEQRPEGIDNRRQSTGRNPLRC